MTWMSYSTRALSLFVVLPLILKNFTVPEISLWYLFSSIIALSSLADFGFRSTFSRVIAFAIGGAIDVGVYKGDTSAEVQKPNWRLVEKICSNMNFIYMFLTLFLLLLYSTLGSLLLVKPISLVKNTNEAWTSWWIIVFTSGIRFYGTTYANYLEGLNKIALVRRVESLMSLGTIVTSIIVLILGGTILELVIAIQIWTVLNVFRNWYLTRIIEEGKFRYFNFQVFEKEFFLKIWKPAWRSGISGLMSNGLTHLSGLLYAQIGSVDIVAGYLLALKLINQVKEISMAPFYSKIPLFSRFRVEGELFKLLKYAKKGMFVSHLVFVAGVILIAVFSDEILLKIGSNVDFVSNKFWILLSFAFFIHRYGAMHMQLYLTTNHVISHIADSVSGIIFLLVAFLTINSLGIYAIPLGMLAGYLGFYSWYSAYHSLDSLKVSFLQFEMSTSLFPLSLLIIYFIYLIVFKHS